MAMRGGVQLAGLFVTHVVELPGGSLPTSCFPHHRLDVAAVLDYADAAADAAAWPRWLAQASKASQEPPDRSQANIAGGGIALGASDLRLSERQRAQTDQMVVTMAT